MADTPLMANENGSWELQIVPSAEQQTRILTTENKFLDKNIVVKVPGATAATTPTLTMTDSTATVVVADTATSGRYALTNSLSGKTTYATAGWITTDGLGNATDTSVQVGYITQSTLANGSTTIASGSTITPSTTATQTINISAGYEKARTIKVAPMSAGTTAAASISGTATSSTATVANRPDVGLSGKTQVSISPSTASTSVTGTYYIAVQAVAPATTISLTKQVSRAGYLSAASQITGDSVSTTTSTSNVFIPLPSAAVNITASGTANAPTMSASTATVSVSSTNITPVAVTPTTSTSGLVTEQFIRLSLSTAAKDISSFTKSITTQGYIADANQVTVSGSLGASTSTYYIPLPSGSLASGNGSVNATSSNITLATATSQPSSGYYITVQGSGSVSVNQAGWLKTQSKGSNTATTYVTLHSATMTQDQTAGTVSVSEGYTTGGSINVNRGTLSTSTASKSGYASQDIAVPSQGYLIINAGYYPNTQISLDSILGGQADSASTTSAHILQGFIAYDVNGKSLTGTIPTYDGAYTIATS